MGDVYMLNGKILSGLPNHAKDIEFDNTGTTLSSTNTEDAIKEVNSNLTLKTYTITATSSTDVPGYNKIGSTAIPSEDLSVYGTPCSAVVEDLGVVVCINSNIIYIATNRTDNRFTVKVMFAKHIIVV